jgi:OOP family OmpA-OmpF porin
MYKLSGAIALTLAAIGAPAAAQEPVSVPGPKETRPPSTRTVPGDLVPVSTHWYVGGEFGGMIVEDSTVDIGAVDNALRLNYEYGYDGGLFVGYDLGAFRIEGEAAYKKADLESYNTVIRLPGEGAAFPPSREFAGGSESALSFMINGMLDFGDDDGISGFVGGGVGMARVKANNERVFANTAPFLDDSDSKLAWQVFAGVRQAISDNIDVTVKYRFFNVDNVRMVAFNGNESEHRFRSHSLLGGITFNFGKPRRVDRDETFCEGGDWRMEAGQCVRDTIVWHCPKDPTDYPSRPVCPPPEVRGPYIVFFDWDRWERETLSAQALTVLDNAAAEYTRAGSVKVSIEAHADTSGSDSYNDELARRRLATIQAYLAEKGVPAAGAELAAEAYGERCPLVETADGVREPQNRRVELYYGPRDHTPGVCPPRPGGY